MASVTIRANIGPLIARWQQKAAMVRPVALAGAEQIASVANDRLLPDTFPGKIARTIAVEASPGEGNVLASARGVVRKPLFYYYVKGTHPHPIDPSQVKALAFDWAGAGEHVIFARIHHPGTRPHEVVFDEFLRAFQEEAHTQWLLALRELLILT